VIAVAGEPLVGEVRSNSSLIIRVVRGEREGAVSRAQLAARLASVALLLVPPVSSATQDSITVDRELQRRLEGELEDAEQKVWIADQDRLVALTGPGVNLINRVNPNP